MRNGSPAPATSARRAWLPVVAVALAVSASACGRDAAPASQGVAVTVLDLGQAAAPPGERYAARAEPITTVQVRSQVEGAIESLATIGGSGAAGHRLQAGDAVAAGDFLVQIEQDVYQQRVGVEQAKLDSAHVQLANQNKEYTRAKGLFDAKVESKEFLDNARTARDAARATVAQQQHTVDAAKIDLERTRVTAPLDGVVLSVEVEPGDTVRKQSVLLSIGDVSNLYVTFGVPASAVGALEIGTLLHMTFDALTGADYAAPITRIAPRADAQSGVFDVTLTLPNPDGRLRPGFVAEVRVPRSLAEAAGPSGVTVPLDSVVRPPGQPDAFGVFVVEPKPDGSQWVGVARLRPVELGGPVGNRVVVRSGLDGDERVIVRGATLVQDGSAVRVIP